MYFLLMSQESIGKLADMRLMQGALYYCDFRVACENNIKVEKTS